MEWQRKMGFLARKMEDYHHNGLFGDAGRWIGRVARAVGAGRAGGAGDRARAAMAVHKAYRSCFTPDVAGLGLGIVGHPPWLKPAQTKEE